MYHPLYVLTVRIPDHGVIAVSQGTFHFRGPPSDGAGCHWSASYSSRGNLLTFTPFLIK